MKKLKIRFLAVFLFAGFFLLAAGDQIYAAAEENQKIIFEYITRDMDMPASAACGVLANIQYESGFNPEAKGDSGSSYGICQWHKGRFSRLKSWCKSNGYNYKSLEGQLNYLNYELRTFYPAIFHFIRGMDNDAYGAYKAAYYWCYHFERPSKYLTSSIKRGNAAREIYWPKFGTKKKESIKPPVLESASLPRYVNEGSKLNFSGKITSETALTKVYAAFYRLGETLVTGGTAYPYKKTYDISGLQGKIHAQDLVPGTYIFEITAANAGESALLVRQPVTVLSKTCVHESGNFKIRSHYSTSLGVGVTDADKGTLEMTGQLSKKLAYFQMARRGGGYYSIQSLLTGTYLSVAADHSVVLAEWKNNDRQLWQLSHVVGSVYCLVPKSHPGRCLTAAESVASGSAMVCEMNELNERQLFKFIKSGDKTPIKVPDPKETETLRLNVPITSFRKTYGTPVFSLYATSNGKITYTSSVPTVAKVGSSGTVTLMGCGKTIITVKAELNGKTKSKTVVVKVRPQKQTITDLKSTQKRELKVYWQKDAMAKGYEIHISTSSEFTDKTTKQVLATKTEQTVKTISGLVSGKTYHVRMRSYIKIDKELFGGPWSEAKTIKIK